MIALASPPHTRTNIALVTHEAVSLVREPALRRRSKQQPSRYPNYAYCQDGLEKTHSSDSPVCIMLTLPHFIDF